MLSRLITSQGQQVRCMDPNNSECKRSVILTIWRATDYITTLLKEGTIVKLYNVNATGYKCNPPMFTCCIVYAIIILVSWFTLYQIRCFFNPFFGAEMLFERNNSLSTDVQVSSSQQDSKLLGQEFQLTTSRQTKYEPLQQKVSYPERAVVGLKQLANKDFNPTFGEIDVVGVVVCNDSPQTVFLADADHSLLAVTFWGSAKRERAREEGVGELNTNTTSKEGTERSFARNNQWLNCLLGDPTQCMNPGTMGSSSSPNTSTDLRSPQNGQSDPRDLMELGYEDMLVPHSVVSASNLQWKHGNNLLPCVYATEMSTFSSHPRQAHLKQALHTLRGEISVDLREFVSSCRDKLKSIVQQTNKVTTPVPYKASNSTSPLHQTRTSKLVTPLHRPLNNNAEELKPPSAAERKLTKLELYGDPPPLSPLVLPRLRGTLRKEFKAPQRISHSPVHSETSPPLSLDSLSD
uniref:BRCA2 OB3 domain-containing protein n=1 Tax=Timema monikensis TaxID=170555 RepID=A0A7R9EIH1_9NEOP|nr:unnamed protein product [Timema monikensis]